MLVDYERVVLGLKRHLATKPHHGQRELAVVIAQLEVEHQIEEGMPERTLRLYGMEFFAEAISGSRMPPSAGGSVPRSDGNQVRALRGDSHPESEEDTHARINGDSRRHATSRSRPGGRARAAATSG